MPTFHSLASSIAGRLLTYSMNVSIELMPIVGAANPNQLKPWTVPFKPALVASRRSCTYLPSYALDLSSQHGTTTVPTPVSKQGVR
ncbi:hypothetical protein TIFTF001_034488 [Ficus carica]|uniref:Uncharacterized protein n=1 Tax=Ficus carica TaxID=3494 RepID=A0AA88JAN3_FICCA|nr:hypothetical protein TIFTF001_034488 [Ficus carica]